MSVNDWDTLLTGASLAKFRNGDYIVQEGVEHQRIYHIAKGSCVIKKQTADGEVVIASLDANSLFGEMTFLEKGKATASVIASGNNVSIYMIEGWFVKTLFVDYPHLAGRFYSYLATILSKRLRDREEALAHQLQQQQQEQDNKTADD